VLHHFRAIERLAVIGEKKWQKGMATFCKPFTKAEVRYFDHSQADDAHFWLQQDLAVTKCPKPTFTPVGPAEGLPA
jgi:hypothetical protein